MLSSPASSFSNVGFATRSLRTASRGADRVVFKASVDQNSFSPSVSTDAFRLVQSPGVVELQTASYRVLQTDGSSSAGERHDGHSETEIILTSMVHLADAGYYEQIMLDASSCDRVLFELIAGPDVSGHDDVGRRTITKHVSPTVEQASSAAPRTVSCSVGQRIVNPKLLPANARKTLER